MEFQTNFNRLCGDKDKEKYDLIKEPSKTVPAMALTVNEIFMKHRAGNAPDLRHYDQFDGTDDELDLSDFPEERLENFSIEEAHQVVSEIEIYQQRLEELKQKAQEKTEPKVEYSESQPKE